MTLGNTSAQVVTLNPSYPSINQTVTITFHADQGNGALMGISPVYMHTGVIIQGQTGWQYVQGNWGTADANVLMTPAGPNSFTKTINIASFYGLPANTNIIQLAFVFRNANGTIVGRENDGSDIFVNIIAGQPDIQNPPLGIKDGINYIDDTTVILQLFAPNKPFVYVIGDFNSWQLNTPYFCKRTASGDRWWVQINNLNPGQEYRFQYWIGPNGIRVADIYAQKILDPWNDQWISSSTYPNLVPYPFGQTTEIVSVLQTAQEPYQWEVETFFRPPLDRMVVYELHVRDFSTKGSFQGVIDSLDYLKRLGINAIELMPVNEFEGNDSWGYNPSFYFAVDKAYGSLNDLKELIDECHLRGIAVILDVVFNHSFGQNPQVRMYSQNGAAGPVTAENPWFNTSPTHPFSPGYDYNHNSPHTQAFMKRNLHYWLQEFKIDGFRFDLSKGLTQNNTGGNVNAWSAYDQSRINNWLRIRSEIHEVDSYAYLILEHFADNSEETVLANAGFMLWGNNHYAFSEAGAGYTSNLNGANHQLRGWAFPNLLSYAESHDEERNMYNALQFGNSSNPNHNVQNLNIALKRMEATAALNIPLVGPKMIWQFGELGYDVSIFTCPNGTINADCKLTPKPVKWDYYFEPDRQRLFKVYAAINKLKTQYPAFSSTNYNYDVWGFGKRLIIQHASMDVVIIANFNVQPINMVPGFTQTGIWYDYFTGNSIIENNLNNAFLLQPGEYRIYTTAQLPVPDLSVNVVDVTFTVDMANQTIDVANGGVSISGNFNEYTKEQMTQVGNGIYSITKSLVEGRPIEYKFRNGNAFENILGSCATGNLGNRSLIVPAENSSLNTVCYSSCDPCTPAPCSVEGGVINTTQSTSICVGTGVPKTITVALSGAVGPNKVWALTDNLFNVISVRTNNSNFNLDPLAPGDYRIYHMSYADDVIVQGITNGSQLEGCFDISNFIQLRLRAKPIGGSISTVSPTTICVGDGVPDLVNVNISGNTGSFSRFGVVSLPSGNIVQSQLSSNINLNNLAPGNYNIYHLSYQDGVNLAGISNVSDVQGCFTASNPIAISALSCPTLNMSSSPNPAIDFSTVVYSSSEEGNVTLEIFDVNGRLVQFISNRALIANEKYSERVDVQNLSNGVYFYKITSAEGMIQAKFIVAR
jgi:hypothetical protein